MSLIDSLTLDQTSALTLVNGKPMIARVNAIRELPAKPLHQVSTAIRQKLLPQRLKAAIKKLNDEIISNSNVEYLID
jgi:hypothetical protein